MFFFSFLFFLAHFLVPYTFEKTITLKTGMFKTNLKEYTILLICRKKMAF